MKEESASADDLPLSEVAGIDRRQSKRNDRRFREDRRKKAVPVAVERRQGERRSADRRRQVDPTTCEREYDPEEIEFMKAIEEYKKTFARPFPTWTEVLEVCKALGYRKVAEKSAIIQNRAKAQRLADGREQ